MVDQLRKEKESHQSNIEKLTLRELREKVSVSPASQKLTLDAPLAEPQVLRAPHAHQGRAPQPSQIHQVVEGLRQLEHLLHGAAYHEGRDS
jgi:hypothetical protein